MCWDRLLLSNSPEIDECVCLLCVFVIACCAVFLCPFVVGLYREAISVPPIYGSDTHLLTRTRLSVWMPCPQSCGRNYLAHSSISAGEKRVSTAALLFWMDVHHYKLCARPWNAQVTNSAPAHRWNHSIKSTATRGYLSLRMNIKYVRGKVDRERWMSEKEWQFQGFAWMGL